jgi:trans-aconitate 2-methyltransferase
VPAWDDHQYLKFCDERTRAARELLARVPNLDAQYVVDLGCGPGNSTALLRERWPDAELVGVDNSKEMLERARTDFPGLRFVEADAQGFELGRPVDVLFANALLQWLPDHAALVPKLFRGVRPGGVLALQMPSNFHEPSHQCMRNLEGPWATRIQGVRPTSPVAAPGAYYDWLALEASHVDIWLTTYEQAMPDAASIVEWVKGTGLRPYLEALTADERAPYLEAYTRAIDAAYPAHVDGRRLFSFPRLFIVAVRRD